MFTEREKEIAMATSRTKLPGTPICYRVAQKLGVKGIALDFGCGIYRRHTQTLVDAGATAAVGYDFHFADTKAAIFAQQYDCVVASNVINVQSSVDGLRATLREIEHCLKPEGYALVNYPNDPRKMTPAPLTNKAMQQELEAIFQVERIDKSLSGGNVVFLLKKRV